MTRKKVKPIQVNMHEAKTRLSQLAELVWQGEEVIIARSGTPYLDLKPHRPRTIKRSPGRYKGKIKLDEGFDELPQDMLDAFEGEG